MLVLPPSEESDRGVKLPGLSGISFLQVFFVDVVGMMSSGRFKYTELPVHCKTVWPLLCHLIWHTWNQCGHVRAQLLCTITPSHHITRSRNMNMGQGFGRVHDPLAASSQQTQEHTLPPLLPFP